MRFVSHCDETNAIPLHVASWHDHIGVVMALLAAVSGKKQDNEAGV
jgi:hypothetical protein